MLTRHRRGNSEALALHEIDFLLGVRRPVEAIDQLRKAGVRYNRFYQFRADSMPVAEFRDLWAEHGAFLRAEARRRGVEAPNPDEYGPVDSGRAFWVWRQDRTPC
jgi:hypothetical protein